MKILDNPPYIRWKFGDDILEPKKVMDQKVNVKNNNKNNTDETIQEQKNIPIHGDVLITR